MRAEINWLLTSPRMLISLTSCRSKPLTCIGGYPSLSRYSIVAPIERRASTKIPMGLSFIRDVPVSVLCCFVMEKYAVRNRMVVPASSTSSVDSSLSMSFFISTGSFASDKFSSVELSPASAWMINARLLILLDAGRLLTSPATVSLL